MNKQSATKKEMLVGLDQKILDRATELSVIKNFNRKLMARPLEFIVGDHIVTVKMQGSTQAPDYFVSCTCNFFQYSGPEYHAHKNGYLLGKPRGSASDPKKRDPDGINKVCKHLVAVMRDYF
jgi:hypothetical protein